MFTLAHPWGLLALAGVPALVAIHFYRQRFQPRDVAGLFLWPAGEQLPPAGRTRSRLDSPLSLFLEILAVLFLAALVSGAKWERRVSVPHAIVVLDHSASMAAGPEGGRASDRAIQAVRRACSETGPLDEVRLTAILSGPRPVVVAGPAASAARGIEELRSWEPILPHHSFAPALELAARLADAGGAIYLVTDHPDRAAYEAGRGVHVIGVGRPLANAGITLADRTLDRVFVRVANYSSAPVARTLLLRDESGKVLAGEPLRIEAGGESSATWTVPPDASVLTVRLEGPDGLARDDEVALAPPRSRNVLVRCEFPPSGALHERVARACFAVPHVTWMVAIDPGDPHLLVGPPGEASAPGTWRLEIGPAPATLRGGKELDPFVGPYFAEPGHPLMEELDFRGVIWSGAFPLKPDAPVIPLLTAGETPLFFQWQAGPAPRHLLNVDLDRSNIHKSPAWPLLFHNVSRLRRESLPGLKRWNVRQGESVSWRHAPGDAVRIADPSGRDLPLVRLRDSVELPDPWKPGIYAVREPGRAEPLDRFSVLFLDPAESDLRGASDVLSPRSAAMVPRMLEETARWPWLEPGLCLLILALVILDWLWLRRREAP